jgi:predicted metallo-beta-lactamase superfamily hydrolase
VPRISSFYGIVIAMYYRDHHPPHFHAIYAEHEAQIEIETLETLAGELPARALRLVQEWAEMHRAELEANWAKAEARLPLDTIEPLP